MSFANLRGIEGSLKINNNISLLSCEFPNLESFNDLSIDIERNKELLKVPEFEKLSIKSGFISIDNNAKLNSLSGLNKIGRPAKITIKNNASLTSITGLKGIHQNDNIYFNSNWQLIISDNAKLNDISGLNYPFYADKLTITNNPNLKLCANEGICNHLLNERANEIYGNGEGCRTETQIKDQCIINSTVDTNPENEILVYPNPTFGQLNIKSIDEINSIVLFDMNGMDFKIKLEFPLDLNSLKSGIYILKIKTHHSNSWHKFIKY